MRIGLLTYAIDRPLSGISRYTLSLARALAKLVDTADLLLLTAGGVGPLGREGFRCVPLRGSYRLPGLMTLGSLALPQIARRYALDVIHDPTGMAPFLFRAGGAKMVVTIHDVIPWSFPGVSTAWDDLIYHHWLPRILPRVNCVLTDSEHSQADIVHYLNVPQREIRCIYPGIDNSYRPTRRETVEQVRHHYGLPGRYILFVGSVEKRKNLEGVLQAFARLRQRIPHGLVIAGPAKWQFAGIMQTIKALDLADSIILTGYVEEKDLPALYSGADLFVFPSFYEGFGLPVLEAMACGVPVITSNISSLPEVAGDAALLIDPQDIEALTAAIESILTDAGLRRDLRQKGLDQAARFTWAETARKTLDVYAEVAHQE